MKIKIVALSALLLLGSSGCLLVTGCQQDYDGQLEVLRNQLKNGAVDLSQLEAKAALMQEQIDKLEEGIKQSDAAHQADLTRLVQELQALKQDLNAQTAGLKSKIQEAQTGVETLKGEVKSVEESFNARLLQISARIDKVDAGLNLLDGRVANLEDQVKSIHEKQTLVDQTIAALQQEIDNIKNGPQIPDSDDHFEQLESALQQLTAWGNNLQQKVVNVELLVQEVKQAAEKRDGELEDLIRKSAQDIVDLQLDMDSKIQNLSSQMTGISSSLSQLGSAVESINVKYNKLDSRVEALRIDYKEQIDKVWKVINDSLTTDVNGLQEVVGQLQSSLNQFNQELRADMTQILESQNLFGNQLQSMSDRLTVYENQLQQFSKQLEQLDLRVTEVEAWMKDFQTAYDVTLGKIKAQFVQLSQSDSQHTADIQFLQGQLQQMETEFQTQSDRLQSLEGSHDQLSAEFLSFKQEMENYLLTFDANFTSLLARLDALDKNLGNFTQEFNQQLGKLNKDFAALNTQVADHSAHLIQLQQQLDGLEQQVNDRFGNYYTKAEVDSLLHDYQQKVNAAFADVLAQLAQKPNKTEVEAMIDEASAQINSQLTAMQQDINALTQRINQLEAQIDALIGRVQSMQLIPDYSTGAVKMTHDIGTNKVLLSLRVKINPASCVKEIVANQSCISIDAQPVVPVRTADDVPVFQITKVSEETEGILVVQAISTFGVHPNAVNQDLPFQVAVSLHNKNNDRTSNYATVRFSVPQIQDKDVEYYFSFDDQTAVHTGGDLSLSQFPVDKRYQLSVLTSKPAYGTSVWQLPEYPSPLFAQSVKASATPGAGEQYAVKYSYTLAYDQNDNPVSSMENYIGVTSDGNIYMKGNLNPIVTQYRSLENFKIVIGLQAFDENAVYGKKSFVCVQLNKK